MNTLEMIKRDFLEIIELEEKGFDKGILRELLKGTVKNLFDFLETKIN